MDEGLRDHALGVDERASAVDGEWSFCVIKPDDLHSKWFSIAREIRRGPGLVALVCVPNGRDRLQTAARGSGVQATGTALNEMLEIGLLSVQRADDRGELNTRKMVVGSPVVVRFNFESSVAYKHIWWEKLQNIFMPLFMRVVVDNFVMKSIFKSDFRFNATAISPEIQQAIMSVEANLGQGNGFLREEDRFFFYVEIPRSSESAVLSYDDDDVVKHLGQTHAHPDFPYGGHYLQVRKDRVMAHAAFRNALETDGLDELRWHLAMVWPGPIALSDIVLLQRGTNLPAKSVGGYAANELAKGDVEVYIHGRRISVIDAR